MHKQDLSTLKITLLGTGTSQGIPVIGCDCKVCQSSDPRDDRLRSGLLVEYGDVNILVDTGPDLRQQMLRHKVERVHAILYTHEHNDHIIGLDDIRPFNFVQKEQIPLFALERVTAELFDRFGYVFAENPYPGSPSATLTTIKGAEIIKVLGVDVQPIPIIHGNLPILGFRFGAVTFITDASYIGEDSIDLIRGTRVLIVNALKKERHPSHYNLSQALDLISKIQPEKAFLTHLSHKMGLTKDWEKELPENVFAAYDGLEIKC